MICEPGALHPVHPIVNSFPAGQPRVFLPFYTVLALLSRSMKYFGNIFCETQHGTVE